MLKLKEHLKGIAFIRNIYVNLSRFFFTVLVEISPILASKYFYKKTLGKKLNLRNPQDFNEKLQWLKLYWQNPLIYICADKYDVRSYVEQCGCKNVLNELYAVYFSIEEIDWNSLPNKFALKTTNGCGTNIICEDKNNLDEKESLIKLKKWMKTDYSYIAAEIHYKKMIPKIICEKYLETESGFLPNDYKIYCFNGKAKLILVATDRLTGLKLNFLDLNWERLDIGSDKFNKGQLPAKPICLKEMIIYSEMLAKPFPFVRVDFYSYKNKPIFGEMTFTPAGCAAKYYNEKGLKLLGDWLTLPNTNQINQN